MVECKDKKTETNTSKSTFQISKLKLEPSANFRADAINQKAMILYLLNVIVICITMVNYTQ